MERRSRRKWSVPSAAAMVLLAAGVAGVSGCQSFSSSRPVGVVVRDAETKTPIPGATVSISYPITHSIQPRSRSAGQSADDGICQLSAVPAADDLIVLRAHKSGYLEETKDLSADTIAAIKPASFFEKVQDRPPQMVVELFAAPRPTIELVVPAGFKGRIHVAFEIHDEAGPAGQRSFSAAVDPTGAAVVVGGPILHHIENGDFVAREATGAELPRNPPDPQSGLWWLHSEGGGEIFFIGTRREFNALSETPSASGQPRGKRGGGGGGGGGRHGRKM